MVIFPPCVIDPPGIVEESSSPHLFLWGSHVECLGVDSPERGVFVNTFELLSCKNSLVGPLQILISELPV